MHHTLILGVVCVCFLAGMLPNQRIQVLLPYVLVCYFSIEISRVSLAKKSLSMTPLYLSFVHYAMMVFVAMELKGYLTILWFTLLLLINLRFVNLLPPPSAFPSPPTCFFSLSLRKKDNIFSMGWHIFRTYLIVVAIYVVASVLGHFYYADEPYLGMYTDAVVWGQEIAALSVVTLLAALFFVVEANFLITTRLTVQQPIPIMPGKLQKRTTSKGLTRQASGKEMEIVSAPTADEERRKLKKSSSKEKSTEDEGKTQDEGEKEEEDEREEEEEEEKEENSRPRRESESGSDTDSEEGWTDILDSVDTSPTTSLTKSPAASPTPSAQREDSSPRFPRRAVDRSPVLSSKSMEKLSSSKVKKFHRANTTPSIPRSRWEIDYEDLTLHRMLASGSSGSVFLGSWQGKEVAVKKLICSTNLVEAELLRFLGPAPLSLPPYHPSSHSLDKYQIVN